MNCRLFEPLVMYFSLTNSPATFQTMMNDIFKELIDEGLVAIYMDVILSIPKQLDTIRRWWPKSLTYSDGTNST